MANQYTPSSLSERKLILAQFFGDFNAKVGRRSQYLGEKLCTVGRFSSKTGLSDNLRDTDKPAIFPIYGEQFIADSLTVMISQTGHILAGAPIYGCSKSRGENSFQY